MTKTIHERMYAQCLLVLAIFILLAFTTKGQSITVSGTVGSTDGALPGASILVKNTTVGTVSNLDGAYSIEVAQDDILVFRFIGYRTQEVAVNGQSTIDVTLMEDANNLDEVVVIGYGSQKKGALTGAISSVSHDAIENETKASVENALQGQVAGMTVTSNSGQPGASSTVRIRGINSIGGNTQPLYVVDGVPLDNTSIDGFEEEGGARLSAIADLNPADIESVQILKDASSTAIYGALGSNGVILITTKQGKVGTPKLSVSSTTSIHDLPKDRFMNMIDANDFLLLRQEAGQNLEDSLASAAMAGEIESTDWQKEVYKTGYTLNNDISLSGGSKELRYFTSLNYYKSDGIVPQTGYDRLSLRANINGEVSDKLSIGTNLAVISSKSQVANTSTGFDSRTTGQGGVVFHTLRTQPTMSADGGNVLTNDDLVELQNTPLDYIYGNIMDYSSKTIIGNVNASYSITKKLSVESRVGFTSQSRTFNSYRDRTINTLGYNGGWARSRALNYELWNIDNFLRYNTNVGGLSIQNLLVFSMRETTVDWVQSEAADFPTDATLYYDLGSGLDQLPSISEWDRKRLMSGTARTSLNYKGKYFLTASFRMDGASQFSEGNKWGFFPAGSVGWKIDKEDFFDVSAINLLKLRVGYGTTGNPATQSGQSLQSYTTESVILGQNEVQQSVFRAANFTNDELRWERTSELNVGLDLGVFTSLITLTVDAYIKNTDDLLLSTSVPAITGFTSGLLNVGSIQNKGVEVQLNTVNIESQNFSWKSSLNMSVGKTVVTSLLTDSLRAGYQNPWVTGPTQRLLVDEELGAFWGYYSDGIYQYEDFAEFQGLSLEESAVKFNADRAGLNGTLPSYTPWKESDKNTAKYPGQVKYKDIDGDGKLTNDDRGIIGRAQPDFVWSLNNTVTYKKFDFSFFFYGEHGRDMANLTYWRLSFLEGNTGTPQSLYDARWTPESPSDTQPLPFVQNNFNNMPFSDRVIEDASYIRLKNISLGYKFRTKNGATSGRVYVSMSDVYTWTSYKGYNPDVSLTGSNALSMGHDYGVYPLPRTYTFGLNLNF
ncbi:TonB-dependent receptor [Reichenbachiella carrageenanivorans]|uniref:TonB-dependent receptor n=1 Tax=Reichenbachiella carrageenanivorans TaxID=2979869 RepID=A0ABY6D107_9BACT|nr:TonB-dependent receptor [Reichenbachiella carrageenanivorans]UXX79855.1 TonB-dependent receptor [Reichenbachiella carrageenanivorans]